MTDLFLRIQYREQKQGECFHHFLVSFSSHQSQRKTDTPVQCHRVSTKTGKTPSTAYISYSLLFYSWQIPEQGQSLTNSAPTFWWGAELPVDTVQGALAVSQAQLSPPVEWRQSHWEPSSTWPSGEGWHPGSVAGPADWALWLMWTFAAQKRNNSLWPWASSLHLPWHAMW